MRCRARKSEGAPKKSTPPPWANRASRGAQDSKLRRSSGAGGYPPIKTSKPRWGKRTSFDCEISHCLLPHPTSASHPIATIRSTCREVAFVPTTDSRSAANKCHHSITLSASCWSCAGTSRPSYLAALRLMTSSNLTGAWTGRVARFRALEDAIGVGRCLPIRIELVTADFSEDSARIDGREVGASC